MSLGVTFMLCVGEIVRLSLSLITKLCVNSTGVPGGTDLIVKIIACEVETCLEEEQAQGEGEIYEVSDDSSSDL